MPRGICHVEGVAESPPQGGGEQRSYLASDGHVAEVYPGRPPDSRGLIIQASVPWGGGSPFGIVPALSSPRHVSHSTQKEISAGP